MTDTVHKGDHISARMDSLQHQSTVATHLLVVSTIGAVPALNMSQDWENVAGDSFSEAKSAKSCSVQ